MTFANAWLSRKPAPPLVAAEVFDELVRDCLTKPFDRALVGCVVSGQPGERCRVEYARRVEARREERTR